MNFDLPFIGFWNRDMDGASDFINSRLPGSGDFIKALLAGTPEPIFEAMMLAMWQIARVGDYLGPLDVSMASTR